MLESGRETPEPVTSHQSLPAQLHKKKYAFGRHVSIFAGSAGGRNLFGIPAAAASPGPPFSRGEAAADGPATEPRALGRSRSKGRRKRQSKKSQSVVDVNSGDVAADGVPAGVPSALQTCRDSDSSCSSPSRLGTPLTDQRPDGSHSPPRQDSVACSESVLPVLKCNGRTQQDQDEAPGPSSGHTSAASVSPALGLNPPAAPDTHSQVSSAPKDSDPRRDNDTSSVSASDTDSASRLVQRSGAEARRPLRATSLMRYSEELCDRRRTMGQAGKGGAVAGVPRRACSTDTFAFPGDGWPGPPYGVAPSAVISKTDEVPLVSDRCTELWRNQGLAAASNSCGGAYNRDGVFGKQMTQAVAGGSPGVANANGIPPVCFPVQHNGDAALPRGNPAYDSMANLKSAKGDAAGKEAEFMMLASRTYSYPGNLPLRGAQRSAMLPPLLGFRLLQDSPSSSATAAVPQYTARGSFDATWQHTDRQRALHWAPTSHSVGFTRADMQAHAMPPGFFGAVGPSTAITQLQANSLIAGLAMHHPVPSHSINGVATGKHARGRPPLPQKRPGVPAFSPALWNALLQRSGTRNVISVTSRTYPADTARPDVQDDVLESRRLMGACTSGTAQPPSGRPGIHQQVHRSALDSETGARTAHGGENGPDLIPPHSSSANHTVKSHAGWGYDRSACNGRESLTNDLSAVGPIQHRHGETDSTSTAREDQAGQSCSARVMQSSSVREQQSRRNCRPGWMSERLQTSPPQTGRHGQGRLKPLQLLEKQPLVNMWTGRTGAHGPLTVEGSLYGALSSVRE